ncbi:MAG TPA: hypothetical protein VE871_20655 [Longimicrobium sp.]|nr:hypothetical protein [Longimicrobium sp.]
MSDPTPAQHPPTFVRLCEDAIAQLEALKTASAMERGPRLASIRALLSDIAAQLAELDLLQPGFADEQGTLTDVASALQAIDLDRGGPHVPRFVDRIVQDLRRIAAG